MLCVMGKLSSKIRAVTCLVRVLFLTVTQQQMMQKLKKKKKQATYEIYTQAG